MIVLDTNVLSELMRPSANSAVVDWLDSRRGADLHITAVTIAEIMFGIELLPDGKRRDGIALQAGAVFEDEFARRVLDFDASAALHYAQLAASRRRAGRPISHADAQIAAICISRDAELATRDAGGFADLPLTVIDPWKT